MRIMYDSTEPNAIPRDAQMVAGYIDGTSFKWTEQDWARFPNAVRVRIARRTSTNDGHVLDVESGIPTVWPLTDQSVRNGIRAWVQRRRAAGIEPTIYCNQLNDWSAIKQIFREVGIKEPQWWVARYNNVRDIPAGAVAKQFANPPLAGFHVDISVVADFWPGVDGDDMYNESDRARDVTALETLNNNVWRLYAGLNLMPAVPEWDVVPSAVRNEAIPLSVKITQLETAIKELQSTVSKLVDAGLVVVAEGEIKIRTAPGAGTNE